jgi:hypothetical protein
VTVTCPAAPALAPLVPEVPAAQPDPQVASSVLQ